MNEHFCFLASSSDLHQFKPAVQRNPENNFNNQPNNLEIRNKI